MTEGTGQPDGIVTFDIQGMKSNIFLKKKDFRTGSSGYFASDKISLPDGTRLQVICNLVIIGSKKANHKT
jgi:hypothetical protein